MCFLRDPLRPKLFSQMLHWNGFLKHCAGKQYNHIRHICNFSYSHGPFVHAFSVFIQDQTFFHKCYIDINWVFHGHIWCVFLLQCVGQQNTHTNHICKAFGFHEPFEYACLEFLLHQNYFYKCCIGVVWYFHEHIQCVFLDQCEGKMKIHTNHISMSFCSCGSFENVF